jgi:hypothetical protein
MDKANILKELRGLDFNYGQEDVLDKVMDEVVLSDKNGDIGVDVDDCVMHILPNNIKSPFLNNISSMVKIFAEMLEELYQTKNEGLLIHILNKHGISYYYKDSAMAADKDNTFKHFIKSKLYFKGVDMAKRDEGFEGYIMSIDKDYEGYLVSMQDEDEMLRYPTLKDLYNKLDMEIIASVVERCWFASTEKEIISYFKFDFFFGKKEFDSLADDIEKLLDSLERMKPKTKLGYLNVRDLKEMLKDMPDDMAVFMATSQNPCGNIIDLGKIELSTYASFGETIPCIILRSSLDVNDEILEREKEEGLIE